MWVINWSKLRFACRRLYWLCNSGRIVSFIIVFEAISFTSWVNSTLFDFLSDKASWLAVSLADTTRLLLHTFRPLCIFRFYFSIVNELLVSLLLLPLGCRVQCLVLVVNDSVSWGTMRVEYRRNVCLITSSLICLVSSEFINTNKFKSIWIGIIVIIVALFLVWCVQLLSFFLLLLLWALIWFVRRVI